MKRIFTLLAIVAAALVACDKNKIIGGGEEAGDDPVVDDHRYVDLGLSVLWADSNVGSKNDGDSGFLIAWGELQPKKEGVPYDYKHYDLAEETKMADGTYQEMVIKYCSDPHVGFPDYQFFLLSPDDAATQSWGSPWRMANYDEWMELSDPAKCKWEPWKHNSRLGAKVTSLVPGYEGNWIFLPYTGMMDKSDHKDTDKGCYWTSALHSTAQVWAHYKGFSESEMTHVVSGCNRSCGLAIRPVRPKK